MRRTCDMKHVKVYVDDLSEPLLDQQRNLSGGEVCNSTQPNKTQQPILAAYFTSIRNASSPDIDSNLTSVNRLTSYDEEDDEMSSLLKLSDNEPATSTHVKKNLLPSSLSLNNIAPTNAVSSRIISTQSDSKDINCSSYSSASLIDLLASPIDTRSTLNNNNCSVSSSSSVVSNPSQDMSTDNVHNKITELLLTDTDSVDTFKKCHPDSARLFDIPDVHFMLPRSDCQSVLFHVNIANNDVLNAGVEHTDDPSCISSDNVPSNGHVECGNSNDSCNENSPRDLDNDCSTASNVSDSLMDDDDTHSNDVTAPLTSITDSNVNCNILSSNSVALADDTASGNATNTDNTNSSTQSDNTTSDIMERTSDMPTSCINIDTCTAISNSNNPSIINNNTANTTTSTQNTSTANTTGTNTNTNTSATTSTEGGTSSSVAPECPELIDYPDYLVCAICLELLFSPFCVKPCSHVFCEPCLRRLARPAPTNTACPLCREVIGACQPAAEFSREVRQKYPKQVAERHKFEQNNSAQHLPLPWLQNYRFLNFDRGTRHPRSNIYTRYSNWWRTALWMFWVDAIGFLVILTLNWFLTQNLHSGEQHLPSPPHLPPSQGVMIPPTLGGLQLPPALDGSGDGGGYGDQLLPGQANWRKKFDTETAYDKYERLSATNYEKYRSFHSPRTASPIQATTYAPSLHRAHPLLTHDTFDSAELKTSNEQFNARAYPSEYEHTNDNDDDRSYNRFGEHIFRRLKKFGEDTNKQGHQLFSSFNSRRISEAPLHKSTSDFKSYEDSEGTGGPKDGVRWRFA